MASYAHAQQPPQSQDQPRARASGNPDTDPTHPLSLARLGTQFQAGIPPVGLLVHAFNCSTTSCTTQGCIETKKLTKSLCDHNKRCPFRRDIDPKKPPGDKNACKPCRLFEALQQTCHRRDLIHRCGTAMQVAAPLVNSQLLCASLTAQDPAQIKSALLQHVNACPDPFKCIICKRVYEYCHRKKQGSMSVVPPGFLAGLDLSKTDPSAGRGPGTYDEGDVECTGQDSLEERDKRGFANAINLEDGGDGGDGGAGAASEEPSHGTQQEEKKEKKEKKKRARETPDEPPRRSLRLAAKA